MYTFFDTDIPDIQTLKLPLTLIGNDNDNDNNNIYPINH